MRRRRKKILGFASLLAVATLLPALAFGQPAGTQPYPPCTKAVGTAESDLAHQKYIAGKQDYDEGNYESAIRRFRDAYNLDCTKHELLIIISAAYERKGDKKEALNALETYVARAPSAPDVGTYQAKIENLKKQIASAPPPTTATAAPTATPPVAGEVQEHSALPWIVVGVGAAAVVVGVVLIVTTGDLPAGCTTQGASECAPLPGETPTLLPATPKSQADQAALDHRRSEAGKVAAQPKIGIGFIAGGAAFVAGGLIWHFLEPTGPKEKESASNTKLTPMIAPSFAGMSLGGRF